jgi:Leucine-rich repeat (LRR) protein
MDNSLHTFLKKHHIGYSREPTQLKVLRFNQQCLQYFPPEILQLKQLVELDMHASALQYIPPAISQLAKLEILDLHENKILSIPHEISRLTQLEYLNLNYNQIQSLPPQISQLTRLHTLLLYSNKISSLPTEFSQLTQLRHLSLSENNLHQIPPEIFKLKQLRTLGLSTNFITNIPHNINELSQLENFYVDHNRLTSLPDSISQMVGLRVLTIAHNKFTQLPLWLIYMRQLRYFTYGDNEITDIHPAITRWLCQSKSTQNVYNNNQSVHDHNIEATTNTSIVNFMKSYNTVTIDINGLIEQLPISVETKTILKSYANCNYVHSRLNLTFAEVLGPIMTYINTHQDKLELCKILSEEMTASVGKCFQGRLSRLIGVLSGYHPAVSINISQYEQIGNVVIMLKKRLGDVSVDIFLSHFVEALEEREYEKSVVDEWKSFVIENY